MFADDDFISFQVFCIILAIPFLIGVGSIIAVIWKATRPGIVFNRKQRLLNFLLVTAAVIICTSIVLSWYYVLSLQN